MNRRELLKSLGAFTAGGAMIGCDEESSCGISEDQTAGPYYLDLDAIRADITEDRGGVTLLLKLAVVDAESCEPIEGAVVEVWHADADGVYSGFSGQGTEDETWLRGALIADEGGEAGFETIYPGSYPGRTPHLHVRVSADGYDELVTQVYFPGAANERIGLEYGEGDTDNDSDGFYEAANELEVYEDSAGACVATGSLALRSDGASDG